MYRTTGYQLRPKNSFLRGPAKPDWETKIKQTIHTSQVGNSHAIAIMRCIKNDNLRPDFCVPLYNVSSYSYIRFQRSCMSCVYTNLPTFLIKTTIKIGARGYIAKDPRSREVRWRQYCGPTYYTPPTMCKMSTLSHPHSMRSGSRSCCGITQKASKTISTIL